MEEEEATEENEKEKEGVAAGCRAKNKKNNDVGTNINRIQVD